MTFVAGLILSQFALRIKISEILNITGIANHGCIFQNLLHNHLMFKTIPYSSAILNYMILWYLFEALRVKCNKRRNSNELKRPNQAQTTISNWSGFFYYPFKLINKILSRCCQKANHIVSFNFGKVQLLNNLVILSGAINFDASLEAYKAKKDNLFSYWMVQSPGQIESNGTSSYWDLLQKVRYYSLLGKYYQD